jgi:hypothetical protein
MAKTRTHSRRGKAHSHPIVVIPGQAPPFLARASDAQLRIGESIPPRSLRPNGFRARARRAPE